MYQKAQQNPVQLKTTLKNTKTQIDTSYIINHVSLIDLALEYGVDLIEQTSGDYVALCPFHDDKDTPSLHIYSLTNTYHCFGCGRGSSVFDFVMDFDNVDFQTALHILAAKVGYSDTYALQNIKIDAKNNKFSLLKSKIELAILKKYLYIYNKERQMSTNEIEIFKIFESFWKWYDEIQYIFNKKVEENASPILLENKFYLFYEKAIKKLNKLQN